MNALKAGYCSVTG